MISRNKLISLDAFSRAQDDVRIRTRSGALITVCCLVVTAFLLLNEWWQFHSIVTRPELVIDRERNLPLEFAIDVTFPHISCDVLNFDIMDDTGSTLLLDVENSGFTKTRIDQMGNVLGEYETKLSDHVLTQEINDKEKYCGSCYGARDQSGNEKLEKHEDWVCCQTCFDVSQAYREAGWAFFDGKNIEQCEREGYVSSINEHLTEGCRFKGEAKLERINGNIHFAPGIAFQNMRGHFHDTSLYDQLDNSNLNFNHIIHHLSFGPKVDRDHKALEQNDKHNIMAVATSPLDGQQFLPDYNSHNYQFNYFIKIVPTRFEYLKLSSKIISKIIETAQFSSSFHAKPITGGEDVNQDPQVTHQRGGTPGLFFNIEMSPLKVIQREQHAMSFSGFLLNCITSIGGVLAVGTVCDKILYKAQRTLFSKKD